MVYQLVSDCFRVQIQLVWLQTCILNGFGGMGLSGSSKESDIIFENAFYLSLLVPFFFFSTIQLRRCLLCTHCMLETGDTEMTSLVFLRTRS